MAKIRKYLLLTIIAVIISGIASCGSRDAEFYSNTGESKMKKTAAYYEIFVRSYADSNADGIGDINGITEKLNELSELGIEGIWLTPVFKSPSYHKYDVTDYYSVDSEYGTNEDLKRLVKTAHDKGIKVILDLPVNHTSKDHPWFKDILENRNSKYRSFYRIAGNDDKSVNLNSFALGHKSWNPLNGNESYYAIFWEGMPDLNYENKQVREEIKKIGKYWIKEAGIDGYRIDGAYHIYGEGEYPKKVSLKEENLKWWNEFRQSMIKEKKDIYIVGEVWTDTDVIADYYKVFDSNFNFELSEKGFVDSIVSKDAQILSEKLKKIYETFGNVNGSYIDAPFLTNHDQNRVANSLVNPGQRKLAASILLTLQGNPFVYYGEELGMRGSKPDEEIREPYLWGNDKYQTKWEEIRNNADTPPLEIQKQDPDSLYSHYKKWLNIRKNSEELKYGNLEVIETGDSSILAYKRTYKNKTALVVHNFSEEGKTVSIEGKTVSIAGYGSLVM